LRAVSSQLPSRAAIAGAPRPLAASSTIRARCTDGGRCRDLAQVCLVVPGTSKFPGQVGKNDNNFHFEDLMVSVNHILVGLLKQCVAGSPRATSG
jgi:D-sedoheptulose 7-phosphate isomerase